VRNLIRVFDDLVNEVAEMETKPSRRPSGARSSSQIIRRYAFCAPSLTLWQDTKAKRTVRASLSSGAVMVRPTRLPLPSSSVKRYQ
jgi:hypothetical protein